MTQYAISAREQYNQDSNKNKFISTVCCGIMKNSGVKEIVKKATMAFLDLTKAKGKDSWINGTEILMRAIKQNTYYHNVHYGLWPWMENTGAGIIQEQVMVSNKWLDASTIQNLPKNSDKQYKVKDEFYETLLTVCKVMGW